MNKRKLFRTFLTVLLISILLEFFVYNWGYWKTLGNQSNNNINISYDSGIRIEENGKWFLDSTKDFVSFEITDINEAVNYFEFDAFWDEQQYYDSDVNFRIFAKDEGNGVYLQLPDRYVNHLNKGSKYTQLHLAGKVSALKVEIYTNGWNHEAAMLKLQVSSLKVNPKIPMSFTFVRFLSFFCILGILIALLPSNGLWNVILDEKSKLQLAVTLLILIFEIGLAVILINKVDYPTYNGPYTKMAHALSKGQVYLDDEVSQELLEMDNPYDTGLRNANHVDFLWDYAYYKGHYYVYFGVVPEILLFLPYYILTGKDYQGYADNLIPIVGVLVGITMLIRLINKKYYPQMSFVLSQLLTVVVSFGSYIYITATHPDFYSVPRSWSVLFLVWGLYFWMSSVREERLSRARLILGSSCMALIAGCRPQLLLGMALSIPIFNYYLKETMKKHEHKRLCSDFMCFVTPIVLIAVLLMYYNYARFGSIFDFGANYNLTSNDMTKRGFSFTRIPAGIYTYLVQLPNIKMNFPFVEKVDFPDSGYQGVNIWEQTAGGFLATNLIAAFGLLAFTKLIKGRAKYMSIICVCSVFIIAAVDTMMAGILPYYYTDFAFFGMIAMVFVVAELEKMLQLINAHTYIHTYIHTSLFVLYNITAGGNSCDLSLVLHNRTDKHSKWSTEII